MTNDANSPDSCSAVPGSMRLLHGVRNALNEIGANIGDDAARRALVAVDVILNELMLREDGEFFAGIYARLHSLSAEGLRLLERELGAAHATLLCEFEALPGAVDGSLSHATLGRYIHCMLAGAARLVAAAGGSESPEAQAWRAKVMATERDLYAHGATQVVQPTGSALNSRAAPTQNELQDYLRRRFPEREDCEVVAYRELIGGFQKRTILFDTHDRQLGAQSCVMRAEKDERFLRMSASDIRDEFEIVRAAREAGVPTAEPLWLESDQTQLGRRFMVSRKVQGENYGSAIETNKDMSDEVLRSFMTTLATIHKVPTGIAFKHMRGNPWIQSGSPANRSVEIFKQWRNQPYMGSANPSPILARVLSWLEANVPQEHGTSCLIHTDYGPHNILVNNGEVSAVLDWESALIGDPAEDISYFIQCTSGCIDRQKAINWYQEAAGTSISEYRLRYYDVFNLIKILIGSLSAGAMYNNVMTAGVEWCLLAFKYMWVVVPTVEEKIAAAEAARST